MVHTNTTSSVQGKEKYKENILKFNVPLQSKKKIKVVGIPIVVVKHQNENVNIKQVLKLQYFHSAGAWL